MKQNKGNDNHGVIILGIFLICTFAWIFFLALLYGHDKIYSYVVTMAYFLVVGASLFSPSKANKQLNNDKGNNEQRNA